MSIRVAEIFDLKQIQALYKSVSISPQNIQQYSEVGGIFITPNDQVLLERITSKSFVSLVYEENTNIIGYTSFYFSNNFQAINDWPVDILEKIELKTTNKIVAISRDLIVHPLYQRRKIGTSLIQKRKEYFNKLGIEYLIFEIYTIDGYRDQNNHHHKVFTPNLPSYKFHCSLMHEELGKIKKILNISGFQIDVISTIFVSTLPLRKWPI